MEPNLLANGRQLRNVMIKHYTDTKCHNMEERQVLIPQIELKQLEEADKLISEQYQPSRKRKSQENKDNKNQQKNPKN